MDAQRRETVAWDAASGLLVVEGKDATLTVKQEHKDANGSSTETLTQRYVLDGASCLISR